MQAELLEVWQVGIGMKQKTEVAAALSMFKTVAKPKAKAEA